MWRRIGPGLVDRPPTERELADLDASAARQERWARQVRLAEEIQRERAVDFPIGGYPWWRRIPHEPFVLMITHKSKPSTWSWRPVGAARSRVTGLASREAAVQSLESAGYRHVPRPA